MDALSEIFRTLHLSGSLFARCELSAPWAVEVGPSPGGIFHAIVKGQLWLRIAGLADVPLQSGDVVLVPHGVRHEIRTDLDVPVTRWVDAKVANTGDSCPQVRAGGAGAETNIVCGSFGFERTAPHPLLGMLPDVVVARSEARAAAGGTWLCSTIGMLEDESLHARAGAGALVDSLIRVIFIQVVRQYLDQLPAGASVPLAALRDDQIASGLARMHREPNRRWTVSDLASEASLSRSAFSARFTKSVGEAPLQYLTRWRMHLAAHYLRSERLSLTDLVGRIGYDSEATFSRLFTRHIGVRPGAYRRQFQSAQE